MKDLTEKLKQTVQNATDAETVAHDALDSIDLRAEAINAAMNKSNQLSDSSAEMKLAIDALVALYGDKLGLDFAHCVRFVAGAVFPTLHSL